MGPSAGHSKCLTGYFSHPGSLLVGVPLEGRPEEAGVEGSRDEPADRGTKGDPYAGTTMDCCWKAAGLTGCSKNPGGCVSGEVRVKTNKAWHEAESKESIQAYLNQAISH